MIDLAKLRILLIYTGGTIGMAKDVETGSMISFNFDRLLQSIPELRLLECEIETISFKNPIDSSDMDVDKWIELGNIIFQNYDNFNGFVVLHGSDTMSYTAAALSFMFENLGKPIILTGSQLPIGDLRTDAKENLITAVQLASLQHNGKPVINEVGLYFEYKLLRGNRTTKVNSEHFEAFRSYNHPGLAESGVHLKINKNALYPINRRKKMIFHTHFDTHIILLKVFPGIHKELVTHILSSKKCKGIIIETFGSGNMSTAPWLLDLLSNMIKKGVHIVNISQCIGGSVQMGQYKTSIVLKKIGVITGKDMTTEAALAKMMYLLGEQLPPNIFKTTYETSLRGEMS